ncbi:TIGR03862 family flavoprotein [Tropicimonas marinistellae]|uniref:TIGR03862 family flavoprotein n=1 Tax=Tropicimonas marinistellae TaxID=1739787 RepID=UPI00082BF18B|nr:TIGR03862 family flavoprotein [Tropicimonas marinistellae]
MEDVQALVIGAGPAGLMAAEMLADAGARVLVCEGKPSVGRKFLMAGKSGLNLTKQDSPEVFRAAYGEAEPKLAPMLAEFGPRDVCEWAETLGQELFTGSSGRVFPVAMKASPLLRAWIARLSGKGVQFRTRWRWQGWQGHATVFGTPDGERKCEAGVTVLALGGASWARLGSDGQWAQILAREGVPLRPFQPANAGLCVNWSPVMARHFGAPIKGVALSAGTLNSRGEFVISERGLEGGGIYAVCRAIREGAPLRVDLRPDWPIAKVAERVARPRGRQSIGNHLRKALRLDPPQMALLMEFAQPLPNTPEEIAASVKALTVRCAGLRPLDEAISTAGGVAWDGVDAGLTLHARPDVHVAGEMLDWEAPTGGYLLTACMATGRWAGRAAAGRL